MTGFAGFRWGSEAGLRLALALPVGLAVYAALSHIFLLAGFALPRLLFPLALVGGSALGLLVRYPPLTAGPGRSSRAVRIVSLVALGCVVAVVAVVAWGAVATPDREWDGLVSWSLRARHLAPPADLGQPFFGNPAVYAHSLTYPFLQPLCLGACQDLAGELPGRSFFAGLFVALLALVAALARLDDPAPSHARLVAAGFGLTPMWFSTGSGAVDSGYAELFVAYLLTVGAAGIRLRSSALLAAAAFCLPLVKPEGLPWGALLCVAVGFGTQGRRLYLVTVTAFVAALLLWLPLQARLLHGAGASFAFVLPLGLGLGLFVVAELQRRCRWRARTWGLGGAAVAVAAGFVLTFGVDARASENPFLREFVGNLSELPARLRDAPALLAGYAQGFLSVRKYGFLFPMVFAWIVLARRLRHHRTDRAVTGFFLAGLAIACAAIVLGDDTDWDHLFKSRFDRLLLQWVGVGWLVLGGAFARGPRPTVDPARGEADPSSVRGGVR